jgi:NhaP-type Na+/H+ or K+/H+ antiporter
MEHHGLDMAVIAGVTGSLILWSIVSRRMERWNISAPMWFVAIGWLLANEPFQVVHVGLQSQGLREMAEIALAIVLFSDAARVNVRDLRRDTGLPIRLLLVGLPITMALGTLIAHVLFPSLGWWICAVIGASVAPTDAALGAAIIDDERVPERIRRVLNVESGLNDGIATPFVKFFLVAAVAGTALESESEGRALVEIAIGVGVGVAIGFVAAWLLQRGRSHGWANPSYRALGVAASALLAYALVVELKGNGFVGAFVAGMAFGAATKDELEESLEFTHEAAELASFVVWFMFGAVMLPQLAHAHWKDFLFAALALTVVRMLPVALVLVGTKLDLPTVGVVGWFGPRGLASVVFALLAVDGLAPDDSARVVSIITATVVMSVVLHGASAAPISARYAARLGAAPAQ